MPTWGHGANSWVPDDALVGTTWEYFSTWVYMKVDHCVHVIKHGRSYPSKMCQRPTWALGQIFQPMPMKSPSCPQISYVGILTRYKYFFIMWISCCFHGHTLFNTGNFFHEISCAAFNCEICLRQSSTKMMRQNKQQWDHHLPICIPIPQFNVAAAQRVLRLQHWYGERGLSHILLSSI